MPMKIEPNPPFFLNYMQPNGFLDASRESHGLWNYYVCARLTYETHIVDVIALEDEKETVPNFKQLFTSIAMMYGVQPEAMAKCWPLIDMQCFALELPQLPKEERYRFDNVETVTLN